jgi:hypothetical protein
MKPSNDDAGRVGDWVNISKEQWLVCAVVSGLTFVMIGFAGAAWLLGLADFGLADLKPEVRARVAGPIGAFLLAIVTFFTIGWRGKVQEDQAVEQRRANDSTDENNLATLLQKGTELIEGENKKAQIAGVACLEAVVTAANSRFAPQGMALLAGHLAEQYSVSQNRYVPAAIRRALENGFLNGNKTTARYYFRGEHEKAKWYGVFGVAHATYQDAIFDGNLSDIYRSKTPCTFLRVTFRSEQVEDSDVAFRNCRFENCRFRKFNMAAIRRNEFINCDFSECEFVLKADVKPDLRNLRARGNFYRQNEAPSILNNALEIDWENLLEVIDTGNSAND